MEPLRERPLPALARGGAADATPAIDDARPIVLTAAAEELLLKISREKDFDVSKGGVMTSAINLQAKGLVRLFSDIRSHTTANITARGLQHVAAMVGARPHFGKKRT